MIFHVKMTILKINFWDTIMEVLEPCTNESNDDVSGKKCRNVSSTERFSLMRIYPNEYLIYWGRKCWNATWSIGKCSKNCLQKLLRSCKIWPLYLYYKSASSNFKLYVCVKYNKYFIYICFKRCYQRLILKLGLQFGVVVLKSQFGREKLITLALYQQAKWKYRTIKCYFPKMDKSYQVTFW